MQLTKLAVAVGVLTYLNCAEAATVFNKNDSVLDIYGKTEVVFMNSAATRSGTAHSTLSGVKAPEDNSLSSIVRLGMAGSTKISDKVYAIGHFEWETPIRDGSEETLLRGRYQYVGINAQSYGTLTAGRGNDAYTAVAGVTDIFNYLDNKTCDHWIFGDTRSGLIMYSLSSLGWDFRLSAQLAADDTADIFNIDSGLAFSFSTRLQNGIGFAYGASYTDFSYEQDNSKQQSFFGEMYMKANGVKGDAASYGLYHHPSYKVNKGIALTYGTLGDGLYLATLFNVTRYKGLPHHLYDYEAVVSYSFSSGIDLKASWACEKYKSEDILEDLTLGAAYSPTPSFKLYAEAQLDLSSDPHRLYPEYYIAEKALGKNRFVIGAAYYF